MDTNFYDVIVCGGETSGLIAGALLARRGFRVMLLGHEPASAAFETGGVTLSAMPALLPPIDDPPAARVFKELDITAHVKRKTATSEVSFRLQLPGQRLDVTRDRALQERELGRAFGAAGGSVGGVIERLGDAARLLDPIFASAITLPPNGFWERREVGRVRSLLPKSTTDLFAPLPAEHPFRAMASLPAVHGTAFGAHDIGPIGEARAFEMARRGHHAFEGGLASLQALLLARLEMFGADRRERLTPAEIVVRRGRVAGVRVRPRDETIGCHHLLWAGSAAALLAALSPEALAPHKRPTPARVDRIPLQPGRARRAGRAAGGHAVAAAGGRRSVARAHRGQRRRDHRRPAESARPAAHPALGRVRRARESRRGRRQLPALAARAGDPRRAAPAAGVRAAHGHARLALRWSARRAPWHARPRRPRRPHRCPRCRRRRCSASRPSARIDVIGLPHATGVKNLFLVSRENLPGLGLEGDLISGWGVARLMSGAKKHMSPRRMLIGS